MKTTDFDYFLPEELIADYPLDCRSSSRLLVNMDFVEHKFFKDIINYLNDGDLLILNNTSVIPARIYGTKDSGGAIEVMLERVLDEDKALVQMRVNRSLKIGSKINFDSYEVEYIGRQGNFYILQFNTNPLKVFNQIGHIPLPPYIKRPDEELDKNRYATVYADKKLQQSVAAPTAGLHFDNELLDLIKKKGVKISTINLSVGAGTFQPVKVENINDHEIHKEFIEVSKEVIDIVKETKALGKKVFAVGTTATRAIETAFKEDSNKGYAGYTELFIFPGYKFKVVDRLITNFHLPRSSLLMLVSAFIGYDNMKQLYKIAVEKKYRFLSYGDSMLLKRNEI